MAIDDYRRSGASLADVNWLKGFLERHRGNTEQAAGWFEEALRLGYRGLSIRRELAMAYMRLSRYEDAKAQLDLAGSRDQQKQIPDRPARSIACEQRDEQGWARWLAVLEVVDSRAQYPHRASRVASTFGHFPEAARLAEDVNALL
jgi:tetratricopeptide (TPR) repeat protein